MIGSSSEAENRSPARTRFVSRVSPSRTAMAVPAGMMRLGLSCVDRFGSGKGLGRGSASFGAVTMPDFSEPALVLFWLSAAIAKTTGASDARARVITLRVSDLLSDIAYNASHL